MSRLKVMGLAVATLLAAAAGVQAATPNMAVRAADAPKAQPLAQAASGEVILALDGDEDQWRRTRPDVYKRLPERRHDGDRSDRRRNRDRDWNRGRDRGRDWNRGRDRGRDWDRGRARHRDWSYDRHRHGRRSRHRSDALPYFFLGWFYNQPYWDNGYSQPRSSNRCEYWSDRCIDSWGYGNNNYYGCLRYYGCN